MEAKSGMPLSTKRTQNITKILATAALGRSTPLTPETLIQSLRATAPGGEREKSVLRDYEIENLAHYVLASQLLQPMVAAAVPRDLSSFAELARMAFSARGVFRDRDKG
jgi:hypothetical protein